MKEHQFFKHQTFFKCPLDTCRSDYKTYGIYYYHLITTHPNFIEPIKEFPCNYCGEIFGMYPDLVKHRKTLNACKGKKFNCNHCEKVFGTALLLKVFCILLFCRTFNKNIFLCRFIYDKLLTQQFARNVVKLALTHLTSVCTRKRTRLPETLSVTSVIASSLQPVVEQLIRNVTSKTRIIS